MMEKLPRQLQLQMFKTILVKTSSIRSMNFALSQELKLGFT
jgi:hypothetical protein